MSILVTLCLLGVMCQLGTTARFSSHMYTCIRIEQSQHEGAHARCLSLHSQLLDDLCLTCRRPVVADDDVPAQCVAIACAVVAVRTAQVAVTVGFVVLLEVVLHAKLFGADGAAEAFGGLAGRALPPARGAPRCLLVLPLAEATLRPLPLGLKTLGAVRH